MKSFPRLSCLTAFICCLAIFGLPPEVAAQQLSGVFDLANADVTFNGIDSGDRSGISVSSAGDVNGDGLDDLLIGAIWADPNGEPNAGETYLIHGRRSSTQLSGTFDLASADVVFQGIDTSDYSGGSVSSAGDVNGDGLDDLLISSLGGDPNGDTTAGETYLIYGRGVNTPFLETFDLATADAVFNGIDPGDGSGTVSSAGDVNGDGLDDLLIGAYGADGKAGDTYLVYGRSGTNLLAGTFELATADVTLNGPGYSRSGFSVSSAGDVNGDGLDDLLIGAVSDGTSNHGKTYLVYGRGGNNPLSGSFDLWNADVYFEGVNSGDQSGNSVSSAGDVNGDGLDDLLIGARGADANGDTNSGKTYLIYGRGGTNPLTGTFDLAAADVVFNGIDRHDRAGYSVSSAGDVNGDGLADLLIGAPQGNSYAGETYLIYGRGADSPLTGTFDLAAADVVFNGIDADDSAGVSVSSAGDVNGDGLADLLIGAFWADPNGNSGAGETYLIYGRAIIPEPTTAALLVVGLVSVLALAREKLGRFGADLGSELE